MALITIDDIRRGAPDTRYKVKNFAKGICLVVSLFTITSCGHFSDSKQDETHQYAYQPPVVRHITFTNERKIDWAKTSTVSFSPTTIDLDIDKLPATSYADTGGFKSFKNRVDTVNFTGYNSLPKKSFDEDKLPQKPLVFHTTVEPAPKIIKAGPPTTFNSTTAGLSMLSDVQGLEGVVVTAIYTDHKGFLWIATNKGIYRYDGETLVKYISTPLSLTFAMTEDSTGRIWMGSVQFGMSVFNPKTNEYSILGKSAFASDSVLRMVTDKYNRIWVGTADGITIINPDAGTYSRPGTNDGLAAQNFATMAVDKQHRLWISHGKSFDIIDPDHKTISNLRNIPGLQAYKFDGMFCDSKGNIWLGSVVNGILNEIDVRRHRLYIIPDIVKQENVVSGISEDIYGRILLSGISTIKMVDMDHHAAKDITIFKLDNYSTNKIIQNVTDKNGNTWLSTSSALYVYKQNSLLEEHIDNNSVASVVMDNKGIIYEANTDGLRIIDRKKKTIRLITEKNGLTNKTIQNIVSLPDGRIAIGTDGGYSFIDSSRRHIQNFRGPQWYSYLADSTGKLWFCGRYGLDIYDPIKKTVSHLGAEHGIGTVTDMLKDNLNNIWLLQANGIFAIIDAQRRSIKQIDLNLPPGNTAILHDGTGTARWIGTSKGLFIIDITKKTALQVGVPQGLVDETVISLLKHGDTIYAGTNKGISAITNSGKPGQLKIVSFGRAFGLEKINVGFWLTDNLSRDGKYIWGDRGVSILNLAPYMQHIEPDVYISGFNLGDEPAYFTTPVQGHSDSMQKYNPAGKVSGPYNLPLNLELPYHQSSLQFSFTSRSEFKPDTTWYRYMLTGTDKTWRKRTIETSTGSYYNLAPGSYTFKASAISNDGIWSKPAIFNFTILPPWWESWWARILFILLFAGLIWYIVHLRSKSLLRSKKLLEQKVAIRTHEVQEQKEELAAQRDSLEQALGELKQTQSQLIQSEKMASLGELTAGIAHEIQNPLNFVNNFSEVNTELIDELQIELERGDLEEVKSIAIDIQENEKKINAHGKRADAIVKGMLQHSRAGSGQKEPTDINKLADEYLRLSYHGLRAKDKTFNAEMATHFDEKLPLVKVLPQEMGRVLLNLFNNSFYAVHQKQKTAGPDYKPKLELSTLLEGDKVVIKVRDNGMGIPEAVKEKIMQPFFTTKPTGEGTGLGLSLSYDIVVKSHGGSIAVNSKEGEFTEFIVTLPLE